ncbi:hypothetical protein JHK85_031947 [Glycine max]|nr:hypothetical protein JHK85_031947 [Glycine max]
MEKVMNILKPKPNPQQLLRDWQRRLRQQCRNIERQIRERRKKMCRRRLEKQQRGMTWAPQRCVRCYLPLVGIFFALTKELVRSRKTVNRLYENKAQMNSISMHLGESVAIARTVGHLSKSAEVMKLVNNLTKAPEMAVAMQEFSKEMTKAGVIEEIVNDAVDTALDSEDIEDEIEEVDKVLTTIAGETATLLPEAVRKERVKQPAQSVGAAEEEAIAEGVDDEEEMEEIRARLAKGFAIGNGLTNPAIQYPEYPDFALDNKIITKAQHDDIIKSIPGCEEATKNCESKGGQSCETALNVCQGIFDSILSIAGDINVWGSIWSLFHAVQQCNYAMLQDWMRNFEMRIPLLEDGIKLLVWVHAMKWSGQKAFRTSPTMKFVVDGAEAGSLNSYGPLSFLKVHKAGHLVPMDQPNAALQMLKSSMGGKLSETKVDN